MQEGAVNQLDDTVIIKRNTRNGLSVHCPDLITGNLGHEEVDNLSLKRCQSKEVGAYPIPTQVFFPNVVSTLFLRGGRCNLLVF
jgi:hypothetical protein